MKFKKKSGQILVLVLLVVVVVLAVGLSVASRNLTNLRTSTQAEQSQRAFSAAEGGVEETLSKLNAVANVIQSGTPNAGCVRDSSPANDTATCTLTTTDSSVVPGGSTVKVKATKGYEKTVEPGDVAQVNLQTGASSNWAGDLKIDWVKAQAGDPQEVTLEVIFVCQGSSGTCMGDPLANGYGQHRRAYQNPGGIPSGQTGSGFTNCGSGSTGFSCGVTIPVTANVRMIRIKPFWNRTTLQVAPTTNTSVFPVQTYEITSTATTETGVSRKVEVRRDALPQLPGIFDYVLYSAGDIIK